MAEKKELLPLKQQTQEQDTTLSDIMQIDELMKRRKKWVFEALI